LYAITSRNPQGNRIWKKRARGSAPGPRWRQGLQTSTRLVLIINGVWGLVPSWSRGGAPGLARPYAIALP
jgi:hypothetical protein